MELKQIIKKWKKAGIDHADFNFSAGGDSMGDTDLVFYDKDGKDISTDIESEVNDLIFANVEFYEVSDGHYMGEAGVVVVTLNEEGNDFDYDKQSESEYSNGYTDEVTMKVTDVQYNYLKTYVSDIDDEVGNVGFNYKIDFYYTEEIAEIERGIGKSIEDLCKEHEFENGDDDNRSNYVQVNDLKILEDNTISFNLYYNVTEYESNN